MLLGINGKKRSGKDTVGKFTGFNKFGFADKLKELALESNPIVYVGQEYQGAMIPPSLNEVRLRDIWKRTGWEEAKETEAVRKYLQNLGVGARRVFGEQFWINQLFGKLSDLYGEYTGDLNKEAFASNIVITDVRFPNEAQAIKDYNGYIIQVIRPETEVEDNHESEILLPDSMVDYQIMNVTSLEDLNDHVQEILADIRRK